MREIQHKKGKIYYSMGEVTEMFDVKPSLIRFWETKFDILKPHKNKKGNRLFTPEDVDNLNLIYHLVKEKGMTLAGAQKRIRDNKDGAKRDMEVVTRLLNIRAMLEEIREELKGTDDAVAVGDQMDYLEVEDTSVIAAVAMGSVIEDELAQDDQVDTEDEEQQVYVEEEMAEESMVADEVQEEEELDVFVAEDLPQQVYVEEEEDGPMPEPEPEPEVEVAAVAAQTEVAEEPEAQEPDVVDEEQFAAEEESFPQGDIIEEEPDDEDPMSETAQDGELDGQGDEQDVYVEDEPISEPAVVEEPEYGYSQEDEPVEDYESDDMFAESEVDDKELDAEEHQDVVVEPDLTEVEQQEYAAVVPEDMVPEPAVESVVEEVGAYIDEPVVETAPVAEAYVAEPEIEVVEQIEADAEVASEPEGLAMFSDEIDQAEEDVYDGLTEEELEALEYEDMDEYDMADDGTVVEDPVEEKPKPYAVEQTLF